MLRKKDNNGFYWTLLSFFLVSFLFLGFNLLFSSLYNVSIIVSWFLLYSMGLNFSSLIYNIPVWYWENISLSFSKYSSCFLLIVFGKYIMAFFKSLVSSMVMIQKPCSTNS